MVRAALITILLLASTGLAGSQPAVILCYDAARDLVQRTLAGECRGEIVNEAKAAEIRERQQRERARILRRGGPLTSAGPDRARFVRFGTAFAIDADGHYLTAAHVVAGCATLVLEDAEGTAQAATVLAADPVHDIALLEGDLAGVPIAPSDAAAAAGLAVRVVGYPEEGRPRIKPLETRGRIAAVGGSADGGRVLAFTAPVRRGNSGGPLLSADGGLLGVVVAEIDAPALFAETGRRVDDLAFATALDSVVALLTSQALALPQKAAAGGAAAGNVYRVVCRG